MESLLFQLKYEKNIPQLIKSVCSSFKANIATHFLFRRRVPLYLLEDEQLKRLVGIWE